MKLSNKIHLLVALLALTAFTACSESEDEESDFANWQERNEAYFRQIYSQAQSGQGSTTGSWRIMKKWSLADEVATAPENHIVVQVLNQGTGSGCPMFTDSVRVHFQGHLMPTAAFSSGMPIGSSYSGTFHSETASPRTYAVSSSYTPDGLATALQQMHIGDRWRLYVPYQLGWGAVSHRVISSTSGSTGSLEWIASGLVVPAYSTLVYDVELVSYYRTGSSVPEWKAKEAGTWIWD